MSFIVLAEDDELSAAATIEALMSAGHAVAHFTNGRQALEAIRFRLPHLVILDCAMPVMSGIELLRVLRREDGLVSLPVLMLTARDTGADEQIATFEGASDYLSKPVEPERLLIHVEDLIAGARPPQHPLTGTLIDVAPRRPRPAGPVRRFC